MTRWSSPLSFHCSGRAICESTGSIHLRAVVPSDPSPSGGRLGGGRVGEDYPENMDWVRRLAVGVGSAPGAGEGVNALVVAGDVAETRDNFARTMGALREQFDAVFYVPGNHDLWLRREGGRYVSRFRHPHTLTHFSSA